MRLPDSGPRHLAERKSQWGRIWQEIATWAIMGFIFATLWLSIIKLCTYLMSF